MFRSATIQHGRLIALAVIVAGVALACTTGPGSGDRSTAARASQATRSDSSQAPEVDGLIANARVAQRQHDWQAIRRFQAELIERVGLPAVSHVRADYQRGAADLAAATARGDSHARAEFRTQLRAMCGSGGLVSAFESCDGGAIVWGD
jgi:hypothetical protein